MMYCTKCGKELQEGSRFCSNCGQPVGSAEINQTSSISKEHIKFDWQGMDDSIIRREEKKSTFDWGTDFDTPRKPVRSSLMFQDKELVERATQELDLGDVRKRAQGLRDDYNKIKEETVKTELPGISSTVNEMSKANHKSIKELEEEIFGSYIEEEKEEPVLETNIETEIVPDTNQDDGSYVNNEAEDVLVSEEETEVEDTLDKKDEVLTENSNETYTVEPISEPTEKEIVESVLEEVKEDIEKEEKLEEEYIEEENTSIEEDEIFIPEEKRQYTNSEREELDEYLEKTIIYNRGDFEKKLEEEQNRLEEEEKRLEEEEKRLEEEKVELEEKVETTSDVLVTEDATTTENVEEVSASSEIKVEEIEERVEIILPEESEEEKVDESLEERIKLDEKFTTFNRKSEEFNKLLDREKEKLDEVDKPIEDNNDMSDLDMFINPFKEEEPKKEVTEALKEEVVEEVKEEVSKEKQYEEIFNTDEEPKKKHGLFNRHTGDYTQSVAVLEEIAQALKEQETKSDEINTNHVTPTVEPKEKSKVTRMTITGLDLEKTYDFNDDKELGKVPKEVVNEELEGNKVDELKSTLEDFYKENPKPKKKHIFAKILITILILLVLFEGAVIACKYFLPNCKFLAFVDYYSAKLLSLLGL